MPAHPIFWALLRFFVHTWYLECTVVWWAHWVHKRLCTLSKYCILRKSVHTLLTSFVVEERQVSFGLLVHAALQEDVTLQAALSVQVRKTNYENRGAAIQDRNEPKKNGDPRNKRPECQDRDKLIQAILLRIRTQLRTLCQSTKFSVPISSFNQ